MTSIQTTALFATPIGETQLPDEGFLSDLGEAIWMLEEGDEAGARWCAEKGYDGYTSYASLDDLPRRAPAFAQLKDHLDRAAPAFADTLHWDLSEHQLVLNGLWGNILGEGASHSGHIHPGSVISGTVYVDMPIGAGALRFEDPRLALMQAAPPMKSEIPEAFNRFVHRTPKAGTVLLWESWLRHEVLANRSDAPRLTLSFNYGLVDK